MIEKTATAFLQTIKLKRLESYVARKWILKTPKVKKQGNNWKELDRNARRFLSKTKYIFELIRGVRNLLVQVEKRELTLNKRASYKGQKVIKLENGDIIKRENTDSVKRENN